MCAFVGARAVLIVTVSHRTFSSQFGHSSSQFFPLSDQINTGSYLCMYAGNAFESMSKHSQWLTMSTARACKTSVSELEIAPGH